MNRVTDERIHALDRPDPALWRYYVLASLPTLIFPPLFLVVLFLAWVRYRTLRYTFTREGVSMRWGRLFRREIILNYARIQDIHLRSNIVERWFGLSRIPPRRRRAERVGALVGTVRLLGPGEDAHPSVMVRRMMRTRGSAVARR
jgi:hypothetical protein